MSMFGFSKGRSQQAGRIDAIFSEEYLAKSWDTLLSLMLL